MIRIALVDDHLLLRKSLALLIGMFRDCQVVMHAGNGSDCIEQLDKHNLPDLLLLDVAMPEMDGIETMQWLRLQYPCIKVLALTMIRNEHVIIRMLKNGAVGYVLKDCEPEELREAIYSVHNRGYYQNESILPTRRLQQELLLSPSTLSTRELSFIRLACTEKTYKEIADEMHISPRTVDGYRDSLFRKLNVGSRVGIAMYAIKNRLVQIDHAGRI
jgi:two-component system invasion response regulator UvrY